MEPSSFVMIPLFFGHQIFMPFEKLQVLFKSICQECHMYSVWHPILLHMHTVTHHSQLSQIVQILLVFQQKGSDNPWF